MIAGIAGARRNAAVALCSKGTILAACEQERIVRSRGVSLSSVGFPAEALAAALTTAGGERDDVTAYATGETGVEVPEGSLRHAFEHHFAHAATAAFMSPFDEAAILVCDHHSNPEMSFWRLHGGELVQADWLWEGPGFARLYSRIVRLLGYRPGNDEHKVEALARLGQATCVDRARAMIRLKVNRLEIDRCFDERLTAWLSERNDSNRALAHGAGVISSVQQHIGDLLLEVVEQLMAQTGSDNLCLAGGLFYNAFFSTLVARQGPFKRVFVSPDPGNPGLAVGAALLASGAQQRAPESRTRSAYLGPEFDERETKTVLDNCKLSYDYVDDTALLTRTVDALAQGWLVGWFQGRMEWGPRALGHRSILASVTSPYVLENLNVFLKKREAYRGYGLSVCTEDLAHYFIGPSSSIFMEYEYSIKDRDAVLPLLVHGAERLRVHTVSDPSTLFGRLLKFIGQATGVPALVNTSFNGFNEPIVCSPRDAVRVFYGTGLDLLIIGNFILSK